MGRPVAGQLDRTCGLWPIYGRDLPVEPGTASPAVLLVPTYVLYLPSSCDGLR